MLPFSLFVRRLLLTALPVFAFAGACDDNDSLDTGTEEAGANSRAGSSGAAASSGTAGNAGGAATSGASGNAGSTASAGESGAAGDTGAAGDSGASGAAGSGAEAGAAGSGEPADLIRPTVLSSSPAPGAIGVATQSVIRVTFSEAMDLSSLTNQTFRVTLAGAAVPGQLSFFLQTATFTPDSPLTLNKTYQISVSVAATDLAGNALTQTYTSTFTTSALAPLGPVPVNLGTAANYAILAKAAISTVPTSAIKGNLGISPAAASSITGFSLTKMGAYWTSTQVVGRVFAADNDPPTTVNLTTAVANMQTAYTDAATRPTPNFSNLGTGNIGGLTLSPGLYNWASSVNIATDVTIAGAANDVWIFQITGNLQLTAAKHMTLSGGAQAKNIFWQVAGAVDFGTTSHSEGIVLCKTAITLGTGASINGRLLAQTAVSLASSTVTEPTP